jgi:hypothetical protein
MNILKFTSNILSLAEQRNHLTNYLTTRLQKVAPNLQSLVGDILAAKLITHAGTRCVFFSNILSVIMNRKDLKNPYVEISLMFYIFKALLLIYVNVLHQQYKFWEPKKLYFVL